MDNQRMLASAAYIYIHLALRKKKKAKPRRWWMTRLLEERDNRSAIIRDLEFQSISGQYKNFTRMSSSDFLLRLVGPVIVKKDTSMTKAISIQDRLALTLRFLASGDSYASLQYLFRISKQSISNIVIETCLAIISGLKSLNYIQMPEDQDEWLVLEEGFRSRWNFPHCLASLDGKHVALKAPVRSSSTYYNFKNFFSIIMFAAVNANYEFIFVDVGDQGSLGDSTVFAQSWFGSKFFSEQLNFPEAQPLTASSNKKVPYFLVGDEAFALHKNLIRVFAGYHKPKSKQRTFNYRLCRARTVVENVFGIIASIFRLLRRPIELEPDKAQIVVLCIAYLHNFLRKSSSSKNLYSPPGTFDREEKRENIVADGALRFLQKIPRRPALSAEAVREELANYFIEDGKVSWQDKRA